MRDGSSLDDVIRLSELANYSFAYPMRALGPKRATPTSPVRGSSVLRRKRHCAMTFKIILGFLGFVIVAWVVALVIGAHHLFILIF